MVTLVNCTPYLNAKGIYTSERGWQDNLTAQLNTYLAIDGWDYDAEGDSLRIYPSEGAAVPANISDFGEVVTDAPFG